LEFPLRGKVNGTFWVGNASSMMRSGAAVKLKAIPNPIRARAKTNIPTSLNQ